ncbi:MAG: 16S rRNA (uracil(1498)-N(3))-methyltransferase [Pelagimonas sp.]|nr:16S rRNA (uracil(1498)-N(3))-methyltransferase [Pelagimonas sp.]
MKPKIRLYVEHPLSAGQQVSLTREQAHYLFGVMRLSRGAQVALFNGHDGEWCADVVEVGKRGGDLICQAQSAPQMDPPDLWLCFAPIKKARTDFIVEKATEMGARRILPVHTRYTNSERIRQDRLQAHAIEAAEQCGGTFVPEVAQLQKLDALLDAWGERKILFCDENLVGQNTAFATQTGDPWAIFIGPEGGFDDTERRRLQAMPQAHSISLGPRILRADTAAVAALTLWQTHLGDWT